MGRNGQTSQIISSKHPLGIPSDDFIKIIIHLWVIMYLPVNFPLLGQTCLCGGLICCSGWTRRIWRHPQRMHEETLPSGQGCFREPGAQFATLEIHDPLGKLWGYWRDIDTLRYGDHGRWLQWAIEGGCSEGPVGEVRWVLWKLLRVCPKYHTWWDATLQEEDSE